MAHVSFADCKLRFLSMDLQAGRMDKVAEYLRSERDPSTLTRSDGSTLLHLACRVSSRGKRKGFSCLRIVKQIIEDGLLSSDPSRILACFKMQDNKGNSPLHEACKLANVDVVEYILKKTVELSSSKVEDLSCLISLKNRHSKTPRQVLPKKTKQAYADLINLFDLMIARKEDLAKSCNVLNDEQESATESNTTSGKEPSESLSPTGIPKKTVRIREDPKEDSFVSIRNETKQKKTKESSTSPNRATTSSKKKGSSSSFGLFHVMSEPVLNEWLHLAAKKQDEEQFNNAHRAGADLQSTTGKYHHNVLHKACLMSPDSVSLCNVKFLIKVCGGRQELQGLMVPDKGGWTPQHIAAKNGNLDVIKLLIEAFPFVLHYKDKDGRTPMAVAACYGQESVMNFLLSKREPDKEEKQKTENRRSASFDSTVTASTAESTIALAHASAPKGQEECSPPSTIVNIDIDEILHEHKGDKDDSTCGAPTLEHQKEGPNKNQPTHGFDEKSQEPTTAREHDEVSISEESIMLGGPCFISHTGRDLVPRNFAAWLSNEFWNRRLPFFYDAWSIPLGAKWKNCIEEAVSNCKGFVAILSPLYFWRYWCMRELDLAMLHGRSVLPIFYLVGPNDFPQDKHGFICHFSTQVEPHVYERWWRNIEELKGLQGIRAHRNPLMDCKDADLKMCRQIIEWFCTLK